MGPRQFENHWSGWWLKLSENTESRWSYCAIVHTNRKCACVRACVRVCALKCHIANV